MSRVSARPTCVQVPPASVERYTPFPHDDELRPFPSPVPTQTIFPLPRLSRLFSAERAAVTRVMAHRSRTKSRIGGADGRRGMEPPWIVWITRGDSTRKRQEVARRPSRSVRFAPDREAHLVVGHEPHALVQRTSFTARVQIDEAHPFRAAPIE